MSIWFDKNNNAEKIRMFDEDSMSKQLGIEITEIGDDFIIAKMPVDKRTQQPHGLLHGGASCVLAETLGSLASFLVIDSEKYSCVGLEINANHLHSVKEGYVFGKATPLKLGGRIHVWDIKITDEKGQLICVSRLTVAIIPRKD